MAFVVKVRDPEGLCCLQRVVPTTLASAVVETALQQRRSAMSSLGDAGKWELRMEDGTLVPGDVEVGLFCERGSLVHLRHAPSSLIEERGDSTSSSSSSGSSSSGGGTTEWLRLNVGGTTVVTSRATLCRDPDSMLAKMFGSAWQPSRTDETGAALLDLDARYFGAILNFLRCGALAMDPGLSVEGVRATAAFLQVKGVLAALRLLEEKRLAPGARRKYQNVMMLACRFASWIGLSGAVPLSVPQKFKFTATRKYGNQWELFSHSNELVALILNHLISMGYWVIESSAGGAGGDVSVYQSYLLASDNAPVDLAIKSDLLVASGGREQEQMKSPTIQARKERPHSPTNGGGGGGGGNNNNSPS